VPSLLVHPLGVYEHFRRSIADPRSEEEALHIQLVRRLCRGFLICEDKTWLY
jgi:hypothetical protein